MKQAPEVPDCLNPEMSEATKEFKIEPKTALLQL
jgi:hypothetical protein